MIDRAAVRHAFVEMYDIEPRIFSAPGRVNLIGEHTDYNDGFVLPVAIDRRTVVAASPRMDRHIRVHSMNQDETCGIDLDAMPTPRTGAWIDYVEGVARALEARGARLRGADMLLESDVPDGAGLSSSAALEISVGYALISISGSTIDRVTLALAGQQAEHEFVGTKSGIMDQYVASLGQVGSALLIDCRSLDAIPIPVETSEHALVICDCGVRHSLASSEYNTRRAECERGVELLQEFIPGIDALRDVTLGELERWIGRLPAPIDRRCRHVVTENLRTLAAADALRAGDYAEMGMLMAASHRSLRDDYEVSCPELDTLVELANQVEGVVGARMTGGGFGGSTINIVRRDSVERFREHIEREYPKRTGIPGSVLVSETGEGAHEEL